MPEFGAGKLRDLVAFEEPTQVDGSFGIKAGPWLERFRRLANAEAMPGNEPVIAQRLQGVNPIKIVVRASTQTRTITSAWRVLHVVTGARYNIRSVVPQPDREWIWLVCESGVAVNG